MSNESSPLRRIASAVAIVFGLSWFAGEAHAQERVNADRIIILSDDIDKRTTGVTHNQAPPASPDDSGGGTPGSGGNDGGGGTPGGGGDDGPGKPGDPGKPDEPGKPDNPGKPDKPGKPGKPGKPDKPGRPDNPGNSGKR